MALASADGKTTNPVGVDEGSWVEKYNTIHPYTAEEENMVQQAIKTIPTEHHHTVSDRRSIEPDHVHRVSPVNSFKGYPK